MTRTIYALLVGINDYLGGVSGLNGCVNDVKRMAEFLALRAESEAFALQPLLLTAGDRENEVKPTRQAVIDGFRHHLCQAGPEDVALFYYSGHGSQEKAPPELWHLEPDHLDETIVCYDSRTDGSWDLADKELGLLIAEVARKGPHILVVLDACHSGSGTRAPAEPGVRLAPNDKRERPLDTFEGFDQLQQYKAVQPGEQAAGGWLVLPAGKHVLLSACRAEEVANERFLTDGIHGVLSHYLLDALQRAGAGLSYRDIFARVRTLVRNQVAQQNPVLEASEVDQLGEPFLGGAVRPQPDYFSLTYRTGSGWVIDGGAVNGIAPPADGETTTLAVFGDAVDLATVSTMDEAIGWARVTAVEPGQSRVEFTLQSGERPERGEGFKAVVVGQPLPPMRVWMQGEEAGLELVRDALQHAGTDGGRSLIVRELAVEEVDKATARAGHEVVPRLLAPLTLIARDGRYLIRRTDDAYPLMVPVEQGYTASAARMAVQRLEHVARWLQVAQLDNKTSALPPDAVTMTLYAVEEDGRLGERLDTRGGAIRLEYRREDDRWVMPRFKIKLQNNSKQRLYCALLDLTETFGISTAGLLQGGGEWLEPRGQTGSEVWAYQGQAVTAGIEPYLRNQGVVSFRDILKLIASTTEVPATLLEQGDLGVATRSTRSAEAAAREAAAPRSSLSRLYNRMQTRGLGDAAPAEEIIADWIASEITITTVHPRDSVDVPAAGAEADLSDGVSIEGHPELQARARLTTLAEGTREAGNLALPPVFRQFPGLAAPFQFSDYRDGTAGLSVLELQVQGETYKHVTPEQPLVVRVGRPIAADEYILPVAFDPETELFLPLGGSERGADSTTIRIDRLPRPMSETRDLWGSIKLLFQKLVGQKLGLDGATTRLAAATVGEGGQVIYDESPVSLPQKVAAAERILLYVHGFTGDTRGLVASACGLPYTVPDPPPVLADEYDLILAFDYENIHTAIEQTAIKLKAHLAAVGLGAGHGKTLHVIAHSLGSQVTRWFIEREGGNKVVQKAVLVGAPNLGTPWATLEDWAIVGLGMAINGLAAVIWPPAAIPAFVGILASIVGGVEKVDTTLDQLKPGSDFYAVLNASEDPGIPYTVIAGNTQLIHHRPEQAQAEQRLMERLVARLASKSTRTAIGDLVFFGKPNDGSVSVTSMVGLPLDRSPVPELVEVPSDHVSYFHTPVGLNALGRALV